jgi:DNA-binding PadR family transcriptional regulator
MSSGLNATAGSLLGFLSHRSWTGWELSRAFEDSIGQFWSITRSQIYRELRTLAERGLIVMGASGVRDRRECSITPLGRAAFVEWIARMPGEEQIRFPLLLTTFFGDAVAPERLREACVRHRSTHAERLAVYEKQLPDVRADAPFPALALDFGIRYERTVLAWIDDLPWMRDQKS